MRKLIILSIIVALLTSCNSGSDKKVLSQRDKTIARIDSLEKLISASVNKGENPDTKLAMYAIEAYDIFVNQLPQDSLSPKYLFKSAQLYEGVLGRPDIAARRYGKYCEQYPESHRTAMIMFYQANALSEAGDTAQSVAVFQKFIEKYPNHDFADDAQGLINFMRMSTAEQEKFFSNDKKVN